MKFYKLIILSLILSCKTITTPNLESNKEEISKLITVANNYIDKENQFYYDFYAVEFRSSEHFFIIKILKSKKDFCNYWDMKNLFIPFRKQEIENKTIYYYCDFLKPNKKLLKKCNKSIINDSDSLDSKEFLQIELIYSMFENKVVEIRK